MSYRRFPDRERALSQLDRHHPAPPLSQLQQRMAQDARTAVEAAGRALRPVHDAMVQLVANAPALLAQASPSAARIAEAMRARAAAS